MRDGLHNNSWVSDIKGEVSEALLFEYVEVWEKVRQIILLDGKQDIFRWRWEPNGTYSASSAYRACFTGSVRFQGANFIWKAKVPPKVKFFAWLAAHNRCWTAERRHRRGLQDSDRCALCDQESETIDHLLIHCCFSREVWFLAFNQISWGALTPSFSHSFMDWWTRSRKRVSKHLRPGCDGIVLLVSWMIWKERNARVFDRGRSSPNVVVSRVLEEAKLWYLAGFPSFQLPDPAAAPSSGRTCRCCYYSWVANC
ncbi:hypothetical protein U9M48_016241 [Paspalum notatum var. saurae]|uniref:Reverse transcriptase zinc-binding domain-containing protein n=1 Tax=Paspalum notatum var. saurae TaxID=547442 RepID=A0AAQ3T6M9_PASNO